MKQDEGYYRTIGTLKTISYGILGHLAVKESGYVNDMRLVCEALNRLEILENAVKPIFGLLNEMEQLPDNYADIGKKTVEVIRELQRRLDALP